jgi:hypothetical protein
VGPWVARQVVDDRACHGDPVKGFTRDLYTSVVTGNIDDIAERWGR